MKNNCKGLKFQTSPISRIVRKSGKRALVEWRAWPENTTVGSIKKYMKDFYVYLPGNTDFYMKLKHRDM